jgi:glycosyltransferase involved in cell wall biosynthesis
MKILLSSYLFHPSIGGLENVTLLFAQQWQSMGHDVIVITHSKHTGDEPFRFRVERRPGPLRLISLLSWADVFIHNNISLSYAWPALISAKPFVISHQVWIDHEDGKRSLAGKLKHRFLRRGTNIAISRAVAASISEPSLVIYNPYDDTVIKPENGQARRDRDFLFVGRLVNCKGADVFIRALAGLAAVKPVFGATIVGDGPARIRLELLARELGLADKISFRGFVTGQALADIYHQHKILVVPSQWEEPFGITALEGIACGCRVIAARSGGLPEAIGNCGILFPKGDWRALASIFENLLEEERPVSESEWSERRQHLEKYSPRRIASAYLDVFRGAASTA